MTDRINHHPILGVTDKREEVTFSFDSKKITGLKGDTIAAALLANGIRTLRVQEEYGTPRGFYCNIGHCYECRITVNSQSGVRACMTPIEENMEVHSGKVLPNPLKKGGVIYE
ncbi:(2Fe-2S)-binding protein [Evansella halocellulosilytica]|uniref:(2Fe-2S)-binding protein n=1 Tax=Evansella halocellulosilytica TaxID=2011013 RepID=UPI000BB8C986|nr:(2Fe-2S)-binding protein [Evansella halocellulosilytica]